MNDSQQNLNPYIIFQNYSKHLLICEKAYVSVLFNLMLSHLKFHIYKNITL